MAWTAIVPMYDASGQLINPAGTVIGDGGWDALVDEARAALEALAVLIGRAPRVWTRGVGIPKRLAPLNAGNGDDGFYASHLADLRDEVHALEDALWLTRTAWAVDPLRPKWIGGVLQGSWDEANRVSYWDEIRDAVDLLRAVVILARSGDGGA